MKKANAADYNPTPVPSEARVTKSELEDIALNLAHFLYKLWREWQKHETIKVDKIIYDNEEPTDVN